jgi:hypothetical protein
VETWTSLRGVEGAKKGDVVWLSFFGLGAMVVFGLCGGVGRWKRVWCCVAWEEFRGVCGW